jgi:two-component system sensor histidine kinase ChiS
MSTETTNEDPAAKPIILLVEDEGSLLAVLKKKLGQLDCQPITAKDGAEALSLFEKHKPSVLVTDVIMPKLNGFDLIQKLRAKYKDSFKVIVLTNLDNPSDAEMAKSLNVNELLLKSNISLRSVEQKVQALLG